MLTWTADASFAALSIIAFDAADITFDEDAAPPLNLFEGGVGVVVRLYGRFLAGLELLDGDRLFAGDRIFVGDRDRLFVGELRFAGGGAILDQCVQVRRS
jgi:hypothetical protein